MKKIISDKIKGKLSYLARQSYWYNDCVFANCEKFWHHNTFDLDVINLGSRSGLYGFNYSAIGLKTANWAMGPQSLICDYEILRNYCSYLQPNATILIPICPFSSLGGGTEYMPDRYYTILHRESIHGFSLQRYNEVMAMKNNPIGYIPFYSMIHEIKKYIKEKVTIHKKKGNNFRSVVDFEGDAHRWVVNWKKEFSIINLSDPITIINRLRFEDAVKALQKILQFCQSHDFKAVLVLPPMSSHLLSLFDDSFREKYIYDFIEKSNITGAPLLDYLKHPLFSDDDNYRDAYFLNEKGAKRFTETVLKELKLIN